jgi:hypothetical protein
MDSSKAFVGSQRRPGTPPHMLTDCGKARSRSPRRNGSANRPSSEPASPTSSPRRAERVQKASTAPTTGLTDDDLPVLSSWALAAGSSAGCVCDCEVAVQHRDLMRRFSEKCAQLREAHAARCGLELKLTHLEALGSKGSIRQRLLAADAAATAAQAELRAERQRFQAREAELLTLLEQGKIAEAKGCLSRRRENLALNNNHGQVSTSPEVPSSSPESMLITQGRASQVAQIPTPVPTNPC